MMTNKAVFLDSDGVLNIAPIHNGKPGAPLTLSELEIPEDVKPCLDKLKVAGYLLICVTNKPDVESGLMTQSSLNAILNVIRKTLPLDDMCVCYSRDSDCYKPKPGLLLEAAIKHNIDLSQSYLIGDRWRDIGAGRNAGCKTIWIDRGYDEKHPDPPADHTVYSLNDATQWILSNK